MKPLSSTTLRARTANFFAMYVVVALVQDAVSAPSSLTIVEEPPPLLEVHPEDSVTLSVIVAGETGALSYEWMLDKGGKTPLPVGPNASEFTIEAITMDDAGIYTCQVSDDLDTVLTSPALLIVMPGINVSGILSLLTLALLMALISKVVLKPSLRRIK